jgi:hypothetical protein
MTVMSSVKTLAAVAAVVTTTLGGIIVANAAGAIAIGECDRAGWSRNYDSESGARERALRECRSNGDRTCRIVVTVNGSCAALAVSGRCGARGWAYAPNSDRARELALNACADYGGNNCTIRISFCDEN